MLGCLIAGTCLQLLSLKGMGRGWCGSLCVAHLHPKGERFNIINFHCALRPTTPMHFKINKVKCSLHNCGTAEEGNKQGTIDLPLVSLRGNPVVSCQVCQCLMESDDVQSIVQSTPVTPRAPLGCCPTWTSQPLWGLPGKQGCQKTLN